MHELLGATEEEFRERAGWEWVLEAAVRRSREQLEVVAAVGTIRVTPAADARIPLGATSEWARPGQLSDIPRQRAAGE